MNAAAHRLTSVTALAAASFALPVDPKDRLAHTAAAATAGWSLASLPDLVEPATSPNHRQFFHSVAFGVVVGVGVYRLYKWEPRTDGGKLLRWLGLAGGAAYLIHLTLDATTKRSLPLVGVWKH